jgi:hypothetical protein
MEGRIHSELPSWAGGAGVATKNLEEKIHLDPRVTQVCCGHTIEPYLAEIRTSSGSMLFVTVWRCPGCGRVTY